MLDRRPGAAARDGTARAPREVGLGETAALPGAQVRERRSGSRPGAGTGAPAPRSRGTIRSTCRCACAGSPSSEPSGAWSSAERVGLIAKLGPRRVVLVRRGAVRAGAVARSAGGPVDDVQPQRPVVELVDAVVSEQVGVAEHDDAARCRAWPATISGAPGTEALAWVRASTRAPLVAEIVVARYRAGGADAGEQVAVACRGRRRRARRGSSWAPSGGARSPGRCRSRGAARTAPAAR